MPVSGNKIESAKNAKNAKRFLDVETLFAYFAEKGSATCLQIMHRSL
jgi:hypothetical protein